MSDHHRLDRGSKQTGGSHGYRPLGSIWGACVNNDTLTVSGEKRFSDEVKEDQFHRIERQYGRFSRSFLLPSSIDGTKISAEHKNGVLTLRLPAREEAKPRQIKVDVRGELSFCSGNATGM